MNLSLINTSEFKEDFFYKFIFVKNEINKLCSYDFNEDLEVFEKLLKNSEFDSLHSWKAILVLKNNLPVVRGLVFYKAEQKAASIGFYESLEDDKDAIALFFSFVQTFLEKNNIQSVKGPIDGNFFRKYRFRTGSILEKPFLGEIQNQHFYVQNFLENGFFQTNLWATLSFNQEQGQKHLFPLIDWKNRHGLKHLSTRAFNLKNWESDLKILYGLFIQSYQNMPDFMEISYREFYELYKNFRFLIVQDSCFFVLENNQPVAFLISMPDPMEDLIDFEKGSKTFLTKSLLMLRLKFKPKSRLLIMYIGKINIQGQRKNYGITLLMIEKLAQMISRNNYKEIFTTFLMDGSKSYAFVPPEAKVVSTYGLFSKNIK